MHESMTQDELEDPGSKYTCRLIFLLLQGYMNITCILYWFQCAQKDLSSSGNSVIRSAPRFFKSYDHI
jgi:hypothetical protein